MDLTVNEKIKIILSRRKMKYTDLARNLGITRQNLYSKLKRKNLSEPDLREIADAMGCDVTVTVTFTLRDTGESI